VILEFLEEAEASKVSFAAACGVMGLCPRTVKRWRAPKTSTDGRAGPLTRPKHALTAFERKRIVEVATSAEYCELSPKQMVPKLADAGIYLASESTIYRVLRAEDLLVHREPSKPRTHHKPKACVATGPGQVWTWDITYMRAAISGTFYYLYLTLDIFSRKIVASEVHTEESADFAACMMKHACEREGISFGSLTLHADNGASMKNSTMLATLQRLGVIASFSRPAVSNDNPFVESIFRTLKYRPGYPRKPFASIEEARAWVAGFVEWYNCEHLHSALRYVTPQTRHASKDRPLLAARHMLYENARRRNPRRWTRETRNWTPIGAVTLNPKKPKTVTCIEH
jgi:putative transposase